jgi:cyclopropane-fatty-acyl-phospholipid synthase
MLRHLIFPFELLCYGLSYAGIQHLIRSPKPLDPDETWNHITRKFPWPVDWFRLNYPPALMRPMLMSAKLRQDVVLGIAAHYDVSNDFYELFLDRKYMFYTCADFPTGQETIEEAQTIKANFLLNLIDPRPGEKILELGCGWGSMMKRIYEETGDKENIYGYTLSKEQVAYNEQHHGFNVEFRNFVTTDYPQNYFDKIYSIGAWEAVRPHEIRALCQKLYGALKPGGRLVQHFFCRTQETMHSAIAVTQIFFPGQMAAPYSFQVRAHEDAGFRITHRSIHDYRDTLRAWFNKLARNRERAIELVGVRTYNRYIVFFPVAWRYFDECMGMLIRWSMFKPGGDQV